MVTIEKLSQSEIRVIWRDTAPSNAKYIMIDVDGIPIGTLDIEQGEVIVEDITADNSQIGVRYFDEDGEQIMSTSDEEQAAGREYATIVESASGADAGATPAIDDTNWLLIIGISAVVLVAAVGAAIGIILRKRKSKESKPKSQSQAKSPKTH